MRFLTPSAVCSSTEPSACCIRHPILRFFVFHRGANPGFPRKGSCPSKVSPRTKRRPGQVSLHRPWEHVRVWIFRSSTFTVFLALAFLFVRPMFPSCGRAEPQGVAPRPGPLPSAPFPMPGPDPFVGLAGFCFFCGPAFTGAEPASPAGRRGVAFAIPFGPTTRRAPGCRRGI